MPSTNSGDQGQGDPAGQGVKHRDEYENRVGGDMKRHLLAVGMQHRDAARKWVRQAEIDEGQAAGTTTQGVLGAASSGRRTANLGRRSKSSGSNDFLVRRATRDIVDLYVHRRASCSVRGRSDLPGATRARMCDRPEERSTPALNRALESRPCGT